MDPRPLVPFHKLSREFVLAWAPCPFYAQGKGYYGWYLYMFWVKEEAVPQLLL